MRAHDHKVSIDRFAAGGDLRKRFAFCDDSSGFDPVSVSICRTRSSTSRPIDSRTSFALPDAGCYLKSTAGSRSSGNDKISAAAAQVPATARAASTMKANVPFLSGAVVLRLVLSVLSTICLLRVDAFDCTRGERV